MTLFSYGANPTTSLTKSLTNLVRVERALGQGSCRYLQSDISNLTPFLFTGFARGVFTVTILPAFKPTANPDLTPAIGDLLSVTKKKINFFLLSQILRVD